MADLIERLGDQGHLMQRDGLKSLLDTAFEAKKALEAHQSEIARLRELVEGAYNEGYMHALYDAPCFWAGSKSCAALEQKP